MFFFFSKQNAAVYSAAEKKKKFYNAAEKYGFIVPLCKNEKTKNTCLKNVRNQYLIDQ